MIRESTTVSSSNYGIHQKNWNGGMGTPFFFLFSDKFETKTSDSSTYERKKLYVPEFLSGICYFESGTRRITK